LKITNTEDYEIKVIPLYIKSLCLV